MAYTRKSFPMHKGTSSHKSAVKQKARMMKREMRQLKPSEGASEAAQEYLGRRASEQIPNLKKAAPAHEMTHGTLEKTYKQGIKPIKKMQKTKSTGLRAKPQAKTYQKTTVHEATHGRRASKQIPKLKMQKTLTRKLKKNPEAKMLEGTTIFGKTIPEIKELIKKSNVRSPAKQKVDPDAPGTPGEPGYEPPVRYEDLDEKGKAIWDKHRAKTKEKKMLKTIEKMPKQKGWDKQADPNLLKNMPYNKKKSPAKTHDGTKSSTTHYADGSAKSKREIAFSKRHEAEGKKEATYQKRKEELLNQGFTQKDADQMIKDEAVTGSKTEKSPLKDATGKSHSHFTKTKHQKKLIKHYDKHKGDADYQKALTKAFGGKTTYKGGKVYITQESTKDAERSTIPGETKHS